MFKPVSPDLNIPELEHRILKFWEDSGMLEKYLNRNKGKKKFSFLDGPITANNPMGVHHAWGRTYKDIFQRYKAMKGFDQRFQNGFDCQGLWVEVEVEKELGFNSKRDIEKFGIENFVNKCKERVHQYSKVQTEQSIRLGQWMDWGEWDTAFSEDDDWLKKSHSYYTMSDENNYGIWDFLKKCHEKGWIYKGTDVMPWCIRCSIALSDMEIATEGYQEMTHKGVTVKLPLLGQKREYLLVWTTTPWTLTSNTAVAVHPEFVYSKVKVDDEIFYLAKSRLEILGEKFKILEEMPGDKLVGLKYQGPFDELPAQKRIEHRVVPWKEVSETEGTGMVHIAPGCGKEDFALGKEYNLAVVAPLDEFGLYLEDFDWLTGRNVNEVTEPIVTNLERKGILYLVEDYVHRYPICWRCDSELVFRLVDEWFISMKELREQISEVAKKVECWIPDFGLERELDWLRNMSDWCISRKRYWGLALPIWECSCGHFEVIGSKEELKKKAIKGWEEFEGHSPHRPWVDAIKIKCPQCKKEISRIPDVGNPWLDAGIVPFSTMKYWGDKSYWQEWFPAHFITECFPGQFRNWFYAILTMSTVLKNKPPFRILLGHALVKDEHGEDMHKSKGNAIWFDEAAEKMGADVMRWMFASHNPALNLNFGYHGSEEIKRKLLTLWNVYSFFVTYANIDNFVPGKLPSPESLTFLDRWILSRLHHLIKFTEEKMDSYEVASVTREIERFVEDLSTWYVRRSRRRFWKSENDEDKWLAYSTLYETLVILTKLIAPIMPFLSEEIYKNLVSTGPQSVHLTDFPKYEEKFLDEELERDMDLARRIVSLGHSARNKAGIKVRQPLAGMQIKTVNDQECVRINNSEAIKNLITEELNIKGIDGVGISLDSYFVHTALPRFERLGPCFGKETSKVAQWIKDFSKDTVRQLLREGYYEGTIGHKRVRIEREDVEIQKKEKENWCVVIEEEYGVALNTEITQDLKNEGFAREFVHRVQLLRKEANFDVIDRIKLYYQTTEALKKAITSPKYLDYIKNETLAVELSDQPLVEKEGEITKIENINGEEAKITLERVRT